MTREPDWKDTLAKWWAENWWSFMLALMVVIALANYYTGGVDIHVYYPTTQEAQ